MYITKRSTIRSYVNNNNNCIIYFISTCRRPYTPVCNLRLAVVETLKFPFRFRLELLIFYYTETCDFPVKAPAFPKRVKFWNFILTAYWRTLMTRHFHIYCPIPGFKGHGNVAVFFFFTFPTDKPDEIAGLGLNGLRFLKQISYYNMLGFDRGDFWYSTISLPISTVKT